MADYQVITSALRTQAHHWDDLATQIHPILRAVREGKLDVTAFFVGNPFELAIGLDAKLHATAYESYRSYIEGILVEADTEFGQIADALIKIAKTYDDAEEVAEIDLNDAYHV